MVNDRTLYEAHDVSGGLAWLGGDVVLVDRVDGETSLVAIDAVRGTVTSKVPLRDVQRVRRVIPLAGRRAVVLETAGGFIEADLGDGGVRSVSELPRALRLMHVDLAQKRLVDAAAAKGRSVEAEQVRCSDPID